MTTAAPRTPMSTGGPTAPGTVTAEWRLARREAVLAGLAHARRRRRPPALGRTRPPVRF